MDELAQPADSENADTAPPGSGSAKGPVRAYGPAVLDQHQPRLTELLPTRPLWAAAAILLALTAVAAIECIHIHVRTLPALAGDPHLAALDVAHRGGLDDWFSTLLLAGGAILALQTWSIRRHRVDDYRGRYRLWLWTAAALAWASLDAGTSIHNALGLGIASLAGQTLQNGTTSAASTISWLALYGIIFGTLAIRLAIEVWQSLPALSAVGIAVLAYLLCGMATLDMLPQHGPLVDSVVRTTLVLLAHVSIVSAIGLFARHVCLDATGRLKVHIDPDKNRKPAKSKPKAKLKVVSKDDSQIKKSQTTEKTESRPAVAAEKSASSGGPLRFAMGSSSSQPPKAAAGISKASASAPSYDDEDDDDADDGDGDEKLSRAERRRLKKLARREGQQRRAA